MSSRLSTRRARVLRAQQVRPVYYLVSRRTRADLLLSLKLGVMLISFAALCAFVVWCVIYSLLIFV